MISGILQLNVNFIFCFRAKEKTKPKKGGGIEELGFMPIAGEELLFEQTVNMLLPPKSGGVPQWRSDQVGEKLMMKLPRQFEQLFSAEKPLDESIGRALAEWARGGNSPVSPQTTQAGHAAPVTRAGGAGADVTDEKTEVEWDVELGDAAKLGTGALQAFWKTIPPAMQAALKIALDRRHKATAAAADKAHA
jgi:hypothetical protein